VSMAFADDAAIENVKTLLDVIYPVDPITLEPTDTETINAIHEAQAAFNALSTEDQETLNSTPYDGTHVSKPSSAKPWGRVLESAVWTLDLFDATDNTTQLPDGSYPNGVVSVSDQGLYISSTVRTWGFRDIVVENGKAYGTLFPTTTKATDSVYTNMRMGGKVYNPDTDKEMTTEEVLIGEEPNERSILVHVPVALGKTMTFAAQGRSFGKIPYRVTTTLDEPVINQEAADNVAAVINALPATIKLSDLSAVEAAVNAVSKLSKLSADAKALLPQAAITKLDAAVNTLSKIVAAQKKLAANKAAADKVTALVKKFPKTVTDADKATVAKARKAYNALNADAKKLAASANTKIKAAEKAVKSTKTINKKTVTSSIVKKAAKKGITTIVLGSKVKTVKSKAFKSAKKVKTLVVKSTKLKKSKVKNSLKSSNVKTVKVPSKKKPAYKKIFTKNNCGKKVTIKTL